ncbi:MAG: long-chain-fatty-acid--CoA ligase [Dehalococcoidia bacterium]
MNTAEFLMIASSVVPDRTALACEGESRTYGEMQDRVNRLANALQSLGVGQGHKVAVMALNSMEYVEAYYATAKLGGVFVPLNYRAKQEELVYMCNNSEASVVFVGKRYHDLLNAIRGELTTVKHCIGIDYADEGIPHYQDLLKAHDPDEIFTDVDDSDPTIIIYTSGTTALPKGVVLTFLSMSVYVTNTVEPVDPSNDNPDVLLVSVPFYHVAGATTMLTTVWAGRKMVVLPQFDPAAWLKAVQEHKVTHSFVVPTMLKRIMEHPDFDKTDLSSLKLVAYGAAPMPYEVVTTAVAKMSCGLMNAYGQTESTSSLTFLGPDDHRIPAEPGEARDLALQRLRSVGRPMDDIVVAIMDPEGEILGPGQEGEIVAQGPRVMSGYLNREEDTSEAIKGGWLHTGDVGWMDEESYLYITGRTKDLIIRGGENIAPGEIEGVLQQHPSVEDAAVIGVPDVEWGEEVKAIVVLKPGQKAAEEELTQFVKDRLASYKAPRFYAFVDDLPRNYVGKVLKTDLRKQFGEAKSD